MRNFTDEDYQDLKKQIENFKTQYPNRITQPNIIFCVAGDQETQNFANQVVEKFKNDGEQIQFASMFSFGMIPKQNFSVSDSPEGSILIEVHPKF